MSFWTALAQTGVRAVVFAIFFLLLAMGLDLLFERSVTWGQRLFTVGVGAILYWLFSAVMLRRSDR
jgi:hypothetical protein